jgi:hypothetical protein
MAYLLEFPPTTLPDNIRKPPYVIFGIKGVSVVDKLPVRIPLNTVLHFIPKLAQYVLPPPENLPSDVAHDVLRTPYIGIDIPLDIGIASFQRIMLKVMQSAGITVPNHQFQHPPLTITSISIRKTWLLLSLPPAGLDGLLIYLQTRLMMGSPVTFTEIKELWTAFPSDSDMLRVMAVNFVQSHIALYYRIEEFSAIRTWYSINRERRRVFKAAENQFPDFGRMVSFRSAERVMVNRLPLAESRRNLKEREEFAAEEAAAFAAINKRLDALEEETKGQKSTKKTSLDELKKHQTMRKSMKWKSTADMKDDTACMDEMSVKLTSALRKVQLEREAESKNVVQEESEEMLQPTVYDPSKPPT